MAETHEKGVARGLKIRFLQRFVAAGVSHQRMKVRLVSVRIANRKATNSADMLRSDVLRLAGGRSAKDRSGATARKPPRSTDP
jgi:hypothetical protein